MVLTIRCKNTRKEFTPLFCFLSIYSLITSSLIIMHWCFNWDSSNALDRVSDVPGNQDELSVFRRRRLQDPAFAACLLVLDDTIRLSEWVAYHYTELPLSSLVIALDPMSSNDSIAEIHSMCQRWKPYGLNITVWPTNPYPKTYNYTTQSNRSKRKNAYRDMQDGLTASCTHHFLDKGKEKWLLLTDTDEYLSYNFIQPGENISHFDKLSIFAGKRAPSLEKRAADRVKAMPIRRRAALAFSEKNGTRNANNTILSFIEAQKANTSHSYFPSESGCTRIVGLTYGTSTTDAQVNETLMTKRFQQHQKFPSDHFSKVILELPKIKENRKQLAYIETIHNPFPMLCGWNGKHSSGQDFTGSVLKVSHYVGTVESWLERGFGKGTLVNKQDIGAWKKKDLISAPYTDQLDTRMGAWFEKFVAIVGEDGAEVLLLEPLRERIEFVRSRLPTIVYNSSRL